MKKLLLLSFALILCINYSLNAQNEADALRYSQLYYGGTARSVSMGGAFGVLGGDFSSLSMNPAGIGIYKSSEITFTPSNYFAFVKTAYNNTNTDDLDYNFNISNAGFVFAFKPKKQEQWKNIQFGFGMNRLNNFNQNIYIKGNNNDNSMLDDFLAKATGNAPDYLDPFSGQLAFNTYLLDTVGGLTQYKSAIPYGGTQQSKNVNINGSINELLLSIGANYNDRLYVGASIGFPMIRYIENSTYEEFDVADTIPDFRKMTYNNFLETHGTGFNFRFGLICRIADWVRVGASIHTPTFYSMNDKWNSYMEASYDNGQRYTSVSPDGEFDYELTTPFRANGGLAFVIGKYALISGEYEYVDYRGAKLHAPSYRFNTENKAIDKFYTFQSNVRAGFEVKVQSVSIRGGYTYSSSPYASKVNDGEKHSFNGGLGFRINKFFLDLAYSYAMSKEKYYLYTSVPYALNDITNHTALITFGIKF